ncbi:MAG TPA: hypothetical protein VFX89_03200 [Gammaproteobacteria bacterium]|nr:hypothetical protein [Gammaproteobacteria bacterium]
MSAVEWPSTGFGPSLEQCTHCVQVYRYEWEHRCSVCDGPVCPFCVIRVEAQWICVGCKEESDADARDVES